MTDLYKILGPDGQAIHGGTGTWKLPTGKRPGVWMPKILTPVCCSEGYHLVELYSVAEWLQADCTIYLAEGKGSSHTDGSRKTAFQQARLIRRINISDEDLRLFAADCAEHVLPIFLKVRPNDDRPTKAIEAARQFARGEITDAAWAVAGAAAWDAAGDAAGAAAGDAAGAAARDAAGDAARAAARAAAARADAAGDAAWDAAGAAAGAAAEFAARAAVWDAEKRWQGETLAGYFK